MSSKLFIAFFLVFILQIGAATIYAQSELNQTIRGQVIDALTETPLPGANVILLETQPPLGVSTDFEGNFRLEDIPVGRVSLSVTFLGYAPKVLNNLNLASAKELVLKIELEEQISSVDEIVVVAKRDKRRPLNHMSTVSARTFSAEETQRYAGTMQDPARMASSFAGVYSGSDERNDIIVRGNSPLGMLWRLEGVNIPNPNHFGFAGSTGGPISILNNNTLGNSDFMTGAFPAEYGNATGAVFDLSLRRGNNEKHEFTGQFGLNGVEFGIEGPLSKKKKASYMGMYRYATIKLFDLVGLDLGIGAVPQYQDGTFMIEIPTKPGIGTFSFFGLGGTSRIQFEDRYESGDLDIKEVETAKTAMGVSGLSHKIWLNSRSSLKSTLAFAISQNRGSMEFDERETGTSRIIWDKNLLNKTISVNIQYNNKLSKRDHVRIGASADNYLFAFSDSSYSWSNDNYVQNMNVSGASSLLQSYFQWQHKFTDQFKINSGLHAQYFSLNGTWVVEPRYGLEWKVKPGHALSAGMGLHSQLQPLMFYYHQRYRKKKQIYERSNEGLDFTKSLHVVMGYDYSIGEDMRLKTEAYFQRNFDVPVRNIDSHYSLANAGESFGDIWVEPNLRNEGTGINYGLELTLEKFFSNHYYFLVTSSLYNSKYVSSDGVSRNTAFNGNFNCSALGGYELELGKKTALEFDLKVTLAGGKRLVPIDLEASREGGYVVYNFEEAYAKRERSYFRTDFKTQVRFNTKRATQYIILEIQNVFNTKNLFYLEYHPIKEDIQERHQLGIFPFLLYKIQF